MDTAELDNRFSHHPPGGVRRANEYVSVRVLCRDLAVELEARLPEGREKSIAITRLEEAMFWANASLARRPPAPRPPERGGA